mgnify:CR=1 FL=1
MASLYPETENIGLEAGESDEEAIEGFRGGLILLTRTRGFALSVIDQSGNGEAQSGLRGVSSDCEKRNTAQLQGWDVYEFVPEAITSMEALNIIERSVALKTKE